MGVTPDNLEIHQHAFYKHHVRHAERRRTGRVFLLGEAAHMMPPWAGQGIQSGIRDVFDVDDALGAGFVLLGDGVEPASLLSDPEKAGRDALGARYLAVRCGDQATTSASDLVDLSGSLLTWLREHRTRAVALRPDRFVAAAHGAGLGVPP